MSSHASVESSARPVRPWAGRRLHFTGVGGCGMSALALVAAARGAAVSGSDRSDGPYLQRLRDAGAAIHIGHSAAHVTGTNEVVYSSAVAPDNVERQAALAAGIMQTARGDLLAELVGERRSIAIAGTHGKTTTAGMVAHVLRGLGESVDYIIGGDLLSTGRNAQWAESPWLVVEADESDRSLLALTPDVGVLTNVEHEHVEIYPTHAAVEEVFRAFLSRCEQTIGADLVQGHGDAPRALATDVTSATGGCSFRWRERRIQLRILGTHNAANAATALETCTALGFDADDAARAIADFPGIARRVQRLGAVGDGAQLIDDYAHHPTQVAAAVAAVRDLTPAPLIVVFRPWGLARTRAMVGQYAAALGDADVLVVIDTPAGYERGGAELVVSTARRSHPGRAVTSLTDPQDVARVLIDHLHPGAVCLTIGCADVAAALSAISQRAPARVPAHPSGNATDGQ